MLGVVALSGVAQPTLPVHAMDEITAPPRLVLFSCPAKPPQLCDIMAAALTDATQGKAHIRRVSRGDEVPTRPGDLGLALRLETVSKTSLCGHLEWQTSAHAKPQIGPVSGVSAADTSLSTEAISKFVAVLLTSQNDIRSILAPAAPTDAKD